MNPSTSVLTEDRIEPGIGAVEAHRKARRCNLPACSQAGKNPPFESSGAVLPKGQKWYYLSGDPGC